MLMSTYEIQVLDMDGNKTYADGGAGSIYGQYPPLVTATRKSGEWQAYDIVFRRPRFDSAGHLQSPARIAALLNGVLVQDNVAPTGPTAFHDRPPYMPGPEKYPLTLQDHGAPVQFRNIWIRELPDREPDLHFTADEPITLKPEELAAYAGKYDLEANSSILVEATGKGLTTRRQSASAQNGRGSGRGGANPPAAPNPRAAAMPAQLLVPIHQDSFVAEWSGNSARVTFTRDAQHHITGLTIQQGDMFQFAKRADASAPPAGAATPTQ